MCGDISWIRFKAMRCGSKACDEVCGKKTGVKVRQIYGGGMKR